MRRTRNLSESLLRSLIREYDIRLDLPYTTSIKTSELGGVGSTAVAAGLTFLTAVLAAKAYIWISDNALAIKAFADNIVQIPSIIANISDTLDIITQALPEASQAKHTFLLEREDTFKTKYGNIKTDDIDKILIKNLKAATNDKYIITVTPKLTSAADLRSSMAPFVSDIKNKVQKLVTAVKDGGKFPDNFRDFDITLLDVDKLSDIEPAEASIANKAMTDAIGTEVFNRIKFQSHETIGNVVLDMEEGLKGGTITRTLYSELYQELTTISKQIAEDIETTVAPVKGIITK